MTLYRIVNDEGRAVLPTRLAEERRWIDNLKASGVLVHVEPDMYVYGQGGLSEAFYRCDEKDADGAVFDIGKIGDR